MDRAVIVSMRRKARGEQVTRLRPQQRYDDVRSKIARWAVENLAAFSRADPIIPGDLANRTADNWTPLLAIADIAGGDWPSRARAAALAMSDHDVDGDGIGVRLLSDIRSLFTTKARHATSRRSYCATWSRSTNRRGPNATAGKQSIPAGLPACWTGSTSLQALSARVPTRLRATSWNSSRTRSTVTLSPEDPALGCQSVTPAQGNSGAGCDGLEKRHTGNDVTDLNPSHASTGARCDDVTDSGPLPGVERAKAGIVEGSV
jgi:putative DNA primase/helicase